MTQTSRATTVAATATSTATKETLEDYTLRFAPGHYRRWSPGVVAESGLGGIAYLADFGANIGIAFGITHRVQDHVLPAQRALG